MPKYSMMSTALAGAYLATLARLADLGTIAIYDGAPPPRPDDPITTQQLVAVLTLGSPGFTKITERMIRANNTMGEMLRDGKVKWYRIRTADKTALLDNLINAQLTDDEGNPCPDNFKKKGDILDLVIDQELEV